MPEALSLVRLLGAADGVPGADRSAVLWTAFGLLDALVTVLDRVQLFDGADG